MLGGTFAAGSTNVLFNAATDRLQIDINGNGVFDAAADFQVLLAGINTVVCAAATDTFLLA